MSDNLNGNGNGKHKVSYVEFVKAWQASSSAKEAAERLGISYTDVQGMAGYARQKKVPLKKMYRTSVDWSEIAELARSLA